MTYFIYMEELVKKNGVNCKLRPHLQVHPLVKDPLAVEFTQESRGGDAEGGAGRRTSSTGDIAEEVVPQLSQQPCPAQQRDWGAGLER